MVGTGSSISVREASLNKTSDRDLCDFGGISQSIKDLAEHQGMPEGAKLNSHDLAKFFKDSAAGACGLKFLIAVDDGIENPVAPHFNVIGHLISFSFFSLHYGKMRFIDDFMVNENYRKCGIGKELVKSAAKIALDEGEEAIEFEVLEDNEVAWGFYLKLGAEDITGRNGWRMMKFPNDKIRENAKQTQGLKFEASLVEENDFEDLKAVVSELRERDGVEDRQAFYGQLRDALFTKNDANFFQNPIEIQTQEELKPLATTIGILNICSPAL